jgi:hypothetical protein
VSFKRRDPAESQTPAVIVTMVVMLIAFAAFSSGLYRNVTPLRLLLFLALVSAALYWFQRGLRKR